MPNPDDYLEYAKQAELDAFEAQVVYYHAQVDIHKYHVARSKGEEPWERARLLFLIAKVEAAKEQVAVTQDVYRKAIIGLGEELA